MYHLDKSPARRVANATAVPCRMHAYGNSFTHCDHVNDNQTREECLTANLQEPVRDYGVGDCD